MADQKGSTTKTIVTGAAGVAVAAGVVAGVVAMADKDTRKTVIKGAQDLYKSATSTEAKEVTAAIQDQYKTTAHQISLAGKKKSSDSKKTQNTKQGNKQS